ncbi:unnamed protein product [Malus baccata var. baccata]
MRRTYVAKGHSHYGVSYHLNATVPCPLNFTILRQFDPGSRNRKRYDRNTECQYLVQGLRFVDSDYLRRTGNFLPPLNASESCWVDYQALANEFVPNFDIRTNCGFQTSWISEGCTNVSTRSQFESQVGNTSLSDVAAACNQSLENGSPCALCTTRMSLQTSRLTGESVGNVTTCTAYPSIYVAAFVGPIDMGTAECLFSLRSPAKSSEFMIRKRKKDASDIIEQGLGSALDSISGSTNLIKFKYEEISAATKNFSRDNIIGRGGYGNVYKGILDDGSEVALKRFKNCSAAGDANFAHEVELYARPTMDQAVKMLETDISVPSIPERPIPLVANIDDIERYSSSGSIQLSTTGGFQTFSFESNLHSNPNRDGESSGTRENGGDLVGTGVSKLSMRMGEVDLLQMESCSNVNV